MANAGEPREVNETLHDDLDTLTALSTDRGHLMVDHNAEDLRDIIRFVAAAHLVVEGPLPVQNSGGAGPSIVGCDACVRPPSRRGSIANLLAVPVANGVIDPAWTSHVYPKGHKWFEKPPDTRERYVRLSWSPSCDDQAFRIAADLERFGFTTQVDRGFGRVNGVRKLTGELSEACRWGRQTLSKCDLVRS